jgi:hypothetical protein
MVAISLRTNLQRIECVHFVDRLMDHFGENADRSFRAGVPAHVPTQNAQLRKSIFDRPNLRRLLRAVAVELGSVCKYTLQ